MTKKKIEPKSKPAKVKDELVGTTTAFVEPIEPNPDTVRGIDDVSDYPGVDKIDTIHESGIKPGEGLLNAEKRMPSKETMLTVADIIATTMEVTQSKGITLLDKIFKFGDHVVIGKSAVPVEHMGHMGAVGFMLIYETPEQALNSFPNESTIEI